VKVQRVTIKNIGIASAFKIGAVISGLLFLVGVIPIFLLQGAFLSLAAYGSSASSTSTASAVTPGVIAGLGLAGACIGLGVGTVIYALVGGVGAAIAAFVYNLTSGWIGGLEVNLERVGAAATSAPRKRKPQPAPKPDTFSDLDAIDIDNL
jgi:xanthosine utilization system XapX-like protein